MSIVVGRYDFNAFVIHLNEGLKKKDLSLWTTEEKASLLHEFVHLYQNCGTVFGQIVLAKQLNEIATISHDKNEHIILPYLFDSEDPDYNQQLFDVYWKANQDFSSLDDSSIIIEHKIKKAAGTLILKNTKYPALNDLEYVSLVFNNKKEIVFDGYVLVECMAALLERIVFPRSTDSYEGVFPYDLPRRLALLIAPQVEWTDLNLACICDYCLDFLNPGPVFYEFIQYIASNNISDITPRIINNWFMNHKIFIFDNDDKKMKEVEWDKYYDLETKKALEACKNVIVSKEYYSAFDYIKYKIESFTYIKFVVRNCLERSNRFISFTEKDFFTALSFIGSICHDEDGFCSLWREGFFDETEKWEYWYELDLFYRFLFSREKPHDCPFQQICPQKTEECISNPISRKSIGCKFEYYMRVYCLEKKEIGFI